MWSSWSRLVLVKGSVSLSGYNKTVTRRAIYYNSLRNGEVLKQELSNKSGVRVLASRIHRS